MQRKQKPLWLRTIVVLVCLQFSFLLAACNWELDTYRALAVAQTGYEQYWRTVVTLHEMHITDDAYYAQAEAVAKRIYNLGKSTTTLMVEYKKLKDPAVKAKIDAAVAELPILLLSLQQFSKGIKPAANGTYDYVDIVAFEMQTAPVLDQISLNLKPIEGLREEARGD